MPLGWASVEEGETERGGAEITPEADTSFTVPSLDFTPEHTEHEVEHAEVVSLSNQAVVIVIQGYTPTICTRLNT